jgi:hypothetical protein
MSADVTPYGSMRLPASVSRELEWVKHQAIAQAARIQAIEFVTERAMYAVSAITELEGQLTRRYPEAAYRLQGIGDMAAAAMAQEVVGIARRLG